MHILDTETRLEEKTAYRHNEKVEGAVIEGNLLLSLTKHYFHAWTYNPPQLLCTIPIDAITENTTISSHHMPLENLEELKHALAQTEHPSIYVFGNKMYANLKKNLHLSKYSQREFLPHARTPDHAVGIEKGNLLVLYGKSKRTLGSLPTSYGLCTKLRYQDAQLLAAFESGHILKLAPPRPEDPPQTQIATQTFFYEQPRPVLDFLTSPLVVSYFGRPLSTPKTTPKTAPHPLPTILQIEHRMLLFIAVSHYHVFVLSDALQPLAKQSIRGTFIFTEEKALLAKDSGALVEMSLSTPA
ncbi:hypothetical protein NEDG_01864 [Nematocida displodere]|uniref:Uncharacterized protein n=1 Tax=Nematocida displodere TaxID=1805483 RepID=A0A177EI73_9MICR|nr:hypothetical protein NEDG_01864 [Nematocida displodere]